MAKRVKKEGPTFTHENVLMVSGTFGGMLYVVRRQFTGKNDEGKEEKRNLTLFAHKNPVDPGFNPKYDAIAMTDEGVKQLAKQVLGLQRRRRTR